MKALPIYGALGRNPLDETKFFFYSPGHHTAFPVDVRYLDGSNNKPKVRSAIGPISRERVNDNRTCETLTTAGGDIAPDNAVEEFTSASFVPMSYTEHGQHLNRPARKITVLFIAKP